MFQNTHHEDRNSNPFNLDKKGILLSHFEGSSYMQHLDDLFQRRVPASGNSPPTEPVTENKPKRIREELKFWMAFGGTAAELSGNAVFDIGVCGARATHHENNDSRRLYRLSLLDLICLDIEQRKTTEMRLGLDMGSVDPSLKIFQDEFYGPGKPSPFYLNRSVQGCGRAVVAGCYGYVSRCQRLVLKERGIGWLSDVHSSYDIRRIVVCDHTLTITGNFNDSAAKLGLSEYIFKLDGELTASLSPHVIYHTNQACRILRGVGCARRIGIHQLNPHHSIPFTESRSRWLAIREFIVCRTHACFAFASEPDSISAVDLIDRLTCGITNKQCIALATWNNNDSGGIDVDSLVYSIQSDSYDVKDFCLSAKNLESLELLVWIDMIIKFRRLSKADEHGGMFAVEIGDLYICQKPDVADSSFLGISESKDVDNAIDRVLLAATGVQDLAQLEPLMLEQEYRPGESLAAVFDNLSRKKNARAGEKIQPGDTWLVDKYVSREKDLVSKKDGTRYKVKLLPSGDVVLYKQSNSRAVLRAIAGAFRGFNILGVGAQFDLTSILQAGAESTTNTMNYLLSGFYGVEGVRHGLSLLFSGLVHVKTGNGSPTSFVPRVAHNENGIVLNCFLPVDIMSQATYFEQEGKVYWLPEEGMNVFEVVARPKSRTTHFEERFDDILVNEVGKYKIKFKVGG